MQKGGGEKNDGGGAFDCAQTPLRWIWGTLCFVFFNPFHVFAIPGIQELGMIPADPFPGKAGSPSSLLAAGIGLPGSTRGDLP